MDSTGSENGFAAAVKAGRYPSTSGLNALEGSRSALSEQLGLLGGALDFHGKYRERLGAALTGQAGDAAAAAHNANKRLWEAHERVYAPAVDAVWNAMGDLRGLQRALDDLIDEKAPQYDDAARRGDHVEAQGILAATTREADDLVNEHGARASNHIQAVDFTAPLSPAPAEGGKPKHHKQTDPKKSGTSPDGVDAEGLAPHDKDGPIKGDGIDGDGLNEPQGSPLRDKETAVPAPLLGGPAQMPPMSSSPLSSGGGGGLTGSGLRPPSLGSMGGPSAGTSPASMMPQVPSGSSGLSLASASPLANAGSGFQSGLVSGMGASGEITPPLQPAPQQQPLQPFASQQPSVAAPAGGSGPAGVPAGSGLGSTDSAGLSSGQGAGSAGLGGGGSAMMPPPAGMAAAAPLAPYSAPGAGAAGGAVGGGPPTSPAAGGAGGQSGSTPGTPVAPSVLAGNPGSSAAMSALAASSAEMNPDLLTAQRVLAELARGSKDASETLVLWAVSLLKTPFGPQIWVASNMGGGTYVPAMVYVPTTAKLAAFDPALPMGWADDWMGSQKPSRILVDHFDRARKHVGGLSLSAMVTTDDAGRPADFGGDFLRMEHRAAARLLSEAPKLDGAHQHRLATVNLDLAHRVNALERQGGDVRAWAAATLTAAVFQAAAAAGTDGLGDKPLVTPSDAQMLEAVHAGTATADRWDNYERAAARRHDGSAMWPELFQSVQDSDGSEATRHGMGWYRHFFRMARMIELVRCWKARPPHVAEVAYCGLLAGFGTVVVNTTTAVEHQLRAGRAS
jgi:hypothetical protein